MRPVIRDDVARHIVFRIFGNRYTCTARREKTAQRECAPVGDAGIGRANAGDVDERLQIDTQRPVGANDDVSAHTEECRYVAHGVRHAPVLVGVDCELRSLALCGCGERHAKVRRRNLSKWSRGDFVMG